MYLRIFVGIAAINIMVSVGCKTSQNKQGSQGIEQVIFSPPPQMPNVEERLRQKTQDLERALEAQRQAERQLVAQVPPPQTSPPLDSKSNTEDVDEIKARLKREQEEYAQKVENIAKLKETLSKLKQKIVFLEGDINALLAERPTKASSFPSDKK